MPPIARRVLIGLAIIAILAFALAAAYAIQDQDVQNRANSMESALSLYCSQEWNGELAACDAWAAGVVVNFPDVVQSCNDPSYTVRTKGWCVTRNESVPEVPRG